MMLVSSCIVVSSNAQARPMNNWSPPEPLQTAGNYLNASDPVVDMNKNGDAIVAWTVWDNSIGSEMVSVSAMTYIGGTWSSITTLSTPGLPSAGPEVAMNDNGDALVVWQSFDGSETSLQATNYIDGTWGTVETIGTPVRTIQQYQVAFNNNGNGSLIWESGNNPIVDTIRTATYFEGAWISTQTISNATYENRNPAMALNPVNGDVVAVWEQGGGGEQMLAAAFCHNGIWGAPQNITSSGAEYSIPAVRMTSDGNIIMACELYDGTSFSIYVMVNVDGTWTEYDTITDDYDLYVPQLAMDDDGSNVVIAWVVISGSSYHVNATVLTDHAWTPITKISDDYSSINIPQLDMNSNGDVVACWWVYDGSEYYIHASIFSGGAWGNHQEIARGDVGMPRAAMGGNGKAIVVWYTMDPVESTRSAYFSIYTPTAPIVTITSPADDYINTTGRVTVEWAGTGVDHYTVSVNGGAAANVGLASSTTLDHLDDGKYNVNVTAYSGAGVSSYATVNFVVDTTKPEVTITNPQAGAWFNTTSVNVTWTASDLGSGIFNMSVSMDDGDFVDVTTFYKEYTSLAEGLHSVYVRVYDNAGNFRIVGKEFNIDTKLPVLNISDPEEDALISSTVVEIIWTGSSESPIGRYWISLDDGEFVDVGQSTSHILTGLGEGEHTVTLKARNFAGSWNTTSVSFTVDSVAPAIEIISPVDGTHTTERNVTIEWAVSDSGSGIEKVEMNVDGSGWTVVTESSYELRDLADGVHTVAIRATDVAGNRATEIVVFTVDNLAPTAIISPSGNNVAVSSTIVVSFSEAMNQTSVVITVEGVTGTISWSGTVATFTPSADLAYGTAYTVTVNGTDLAGNNMTAMTSSFTTMKNECTISGIVKDKDGNAIANATVTLSNGMTTTTDVNGRFEFTAVPSGTYTLNVTKDGFQTITQTISAVAGQSTALETMSMAKNASGSGDGDNTMWIVGIIGVVVVAVLGIAFVMYRKKK